MKNQGIIEIDGFELAYQIEGEGVPVLVIGSSVYYPRLFSQELRQELKFIFIDHRGHVKPPRTLEKKDYTLDRILKDIEIMREALRLKNFMVLGHSGNAFLATAYTMKYPTHVSKMILLNTAPTNHPKRQEQSIAFFQENAEPKRKEKFEKDISLLEEDIRKEPERRFAHMCIRMGAQSFYDYSFDGAYLWDGVYTSMPVIDYIWGEVFAQLDLRQLLPQIQKPIFLGLGKYDYLVGPYTLWDTIEKNHPHIQKVIFEQSGHNPMLEEPHVFDTRLLNWIWE